VITPTQRVAVLAMKQYDGSVAMLHSRPRYLVSELHIACIVVPSVWKRDRRRYRCVYLLHRVDGKTQVVPFGTYDAALMALHLL